MTKTNTNSATSKATRYKYAPIREAVIEIRVSASESTPIGKLKDVFNGQDGNLGELHQAQGEIVFSPQGCVTHHEQQHVGFILQRPPFHLSG